MADFTVASRIGQGVGQNAFAGGGTQMNPLNMMQLMQTMELQRAAEQRALAGEARAQALHGPQLGTANLRLQEAEMDLRKKREEDELSNLYAGFRQKYDDPFSDEALKEARKTNAKLYSTLLDQKTAHGKLAAETEAKTAEALTKKLELNQKTASLWLPALENGLVTDQKSYSAMRKDLLRGQENLASLFPEEYSPEAVAKFKQAFSGTKKISQMSMANGDILILVNGEPYGTVDPTVKGGAGVMPGVRPFGPANPPPADLPAAAPTAAPTGAQPRAAGPLSPEAATMTTNALRRFEGFREKPYWDVDAYRTGYGSDTITTPEGRVVRVQPGMTVTREDAERDLARRRTEFASTAARQAGETWSNLPPGAHAGLTSVAYNYGSLPSRILGAVRSGDTEAIARAVEGLAMDNNGINYNRRMQEAAMIRGQAMPAAAGSPAVSASIGATERGMMGQPQAPANAMAPLFAAQLMQQQNAMAAPQQALPNIAPGLTQVAAPAPTTTEPSTPRPRREDYPTHGQFIEANRLWEQEQSDIRKERRKAEEAAKPKPLTPAQEKKLRDDIAVDYKSVQTTIDAMDDVVKTVKRMRDVPDNAKSAILGYTGEYLPNLTSSAKDAQTRFNDLKGKVISLGKEAQSLSGAIGSIANQEWGILASTIASLDPKNLDPKILNDQLDIIEAKAKGTVTRIKDAYRRQYQEEMGRFGDRFKLPENEKSAKTIVKRGKEKDTGRAVVQYSDGTIDYAD